VLCEIALGELDLRYASLRLHKPQAVARLKASVAQGGIRNPILASTAVETGRYVLLDGLKRVRVAREIPIAKLWAHLVALDAPAALCAMLSSNVSHAGVTAIEEGWILRHLCQTLGLSQQAAGERVGHDQSWVSLRIRLVDDLETKLQDDLRLGLLSPTQARELGRLPRGRQQLEAAQMVEQHGLTSRQTTRVVDLLLEAGEPQIRHEILDDPLRWLAQTQKERAKPVVDPRLSPAGQALLRTLGAWEATSWRLERQLTEGLGAEDALLLSSALEQALAQGQRVLSQLGTRVRKAGPIPDVHQA